MASIVATSALGERPADNDLAARFRKFESDRQWERDQLQARFVRVGVSLIGFGSVVAFGGNAIMSSGVISASPTTGAASFAAGTAVLTAGLLTITLAEYDLDELFSRRRTLGTGAAAFVALIFLACAATFSPAWACVVLPLAYFFAHRHQVLDRTPGFPRWTQLVLVGSLSIAWAVGYVGSNWIYALSLSSDASNDYERTGYMVLGVYYLLAAVIIAVVYRRWSWRMDATPCAWRCAYTWCSALGVGMMSDALALPWYPALHALSGASLFLPCAAFLLYRDAIAGFLERSFYRGRRLQDGAFIAELAQPTRACVGDRRDWHDPATSTWHEGRVVKVRMTSVSIRLVVAENAVRRFSTNEANDDLKTVPTAGCSISAEQLHKQAEKTLRGIPGDSITLMLLQTSEGGPETSALGQKCKPGEIDFFISHSWHDDPAAKFAAVKQVPLCEARCVGACRHNTRTRDGTRL
jgi:hypothetical protein